MYYNFLNSFVNNRDRTTIWHDRITHNYGIWNWTYIQILPMTSNKFFVFSTFRKILFDTAMFFNLEHRDSVKIQGDQKMLVILDFGKRDSIKRELLTIMKGVQKSLISVVYYSLVVDIKNYYRMLVFIIVIL